MSDFQILDPAPVEETPVETPPVETPKPEEPVEPTEGHEEGNEGQQEPIHKKKTGSQRAREQAQRERDQRIRLEAENEALRRQLGIKPEPKPVTTDGEPNVDDFESPAAYYKALARWEVKQELTAQTSKQQQTQKNEVWEQRKDAARAKYDDFDEALDSAVDTPMSPVMAEAMLGSEVGGDLAYHFATHPEEAKKIASMSAYEAGKAISRLESAYSVTNKPKPTSAPKPPSPVKAPASAPPRESDGMEVY